MRLTDTIAAISTPYGKGGVAMIRISGESAIEIADRVFLAKRKNMKFGTAKLIVDFCYVGATLIICLAAGLDFGIVREGTVIFAAANGVLINLFLPHIEKLFTAVEKLCGVKKTLV
jgi:uncharacterized membrane protein YczE